MKKRGLRAVIAAAFVIAVAAGVPAQVWAAPTVEAGSTEGTVQSVTVTPQTMTLETGKTAKLTATVKVGSGKAPGVTWSVADTKIAEIDANGTVTAKTAGETVVTAKAGEQTASCTLTVKKAPVPESLSGSGAVQEAQLRAILEDQKGSRPVVKLQSGSVKIPVETLKDVLKDNSKVQSVTFAVKASKPYTLTYTRAQIKSMSNKKDLSFDVSVTENTQKSGAFITLNVKELLAKASPKMTLTVSDAFANKTLELYVEDELVAKDLKVKRSSTPVVAGAYQTAVAAATAKPSKPSKTYYYSVEDIPISSGAGEYELRVVEEDDPSDTASSKGPRLDTKEVQMSVDRIYDFLVKGNQDTKNLKVSVGDSKIASVKLADKNDSRGARYRITAKAVGKTDITVSYQGDTSKIKVDVKKAGSVPAIYSKGSITMDTAQYKMPPGGEYTIGSVIRDKNGKELTAEQVRGLVTSGKLKVRDSRTGSVVQLEQLPTGNFRVTGKNPGSCYIIYEIGGTHASVRIDVQRGVKARGSTVRNTSYFTE